MKGPVQCSMNSEEVGGKWSRAAGTVLAYGKIGLCWNHLSRTMQVDEMILIK